MGDGRTRSARPAPIVAGPGKTHNRFGPKRLDSHSYLTGVLVQWHGMTTHFVGEIHLAFDRPVDGRATATAPAALAADATTALEAASHRGLAQTFTPPPRFSLCSSTRTTFGSYRKARPQPITALSSCASETFSVLEGHSPGDFPHIDVRRLQSCAARRRCNQRRDGFHLHAPRPLAEICLEPTRTTQMTA